MILIYTFSNQWSFLPSFIKAFENEDIDTYCIPRKIRTDKLLDMIRVNEYDFILGIGLGRKDGKRIRFDKKYNNQYGKSAVSEGKKQYYEYTWDLKKFKDCYKTEKTTNGPCNRSAYLISKVIEEDNLSTKFAFIHIPKKFDQDVLKKYVIKWVSEG